MWESRSPRDYFKKRIGSFEPILFFYFGDLSFISLLHSDRRPVQSPDGTAWATVWESRSPRDYFKKPPSLLRRGLLAFAASIKAHMLCRATGL